MEENPTKQRATDKDVDRLWGEPRPALVGTTDNHCNYAVFSSFFVSKGTSEGQRFAIKTIKQHDICGKKSVKNGTTTKPSNHAVFKALF